MKNMVYFFKLMLETILVIGRRILGKSHIANWSLKTELIWATTRLTILSSNKLGLGWYRELGQKFKPKSSKADLVDVKIDQIEAMKFLIVKPKPSGNSLNKEIIYFHGGGFVAGSPEASIEFLTQLALKANAIVYAPFYPLAPENTYPAANDFSLNLTKKLLQNTSQLEVYLGGDSAGASLVLSIMKNLDAKCHSLIKGCILISPWVDPLANSGTIQSNSKFDIGNRAFLISCYNTYLNNGNILSNYPLRYSEDNLPMLPKTLVTIGELEMLLDQSIELVNNIRNKGINVELKQYSSMFHTFWNLAPNIKEAEILISDVSMWLNEQNENLTQ